MPQNSNDVLLEVRDLCQYFTAGRGKHAKTTKAVDHVSFTVRKGETFGLVGESGCGKTTTGRSIIRLYDPTSGTVIFDGTEVTGPMNAQKRKFLAERITMIFQDPIESLNPRMTIEEIVGEALKERGIKNKEELHNRVVSMLQKVGLNEEHATRYPHEFSGGQRQRIGIARAMIVNPQMVIADEPVSALDVSIQAQVINLLNDLKEEMGLTILFIAHNLSVVKYFSDRIGVMYYGHLVEVARSEDLYRNPAHPYTKALLSAIPEPNPLKERNRKRIEYDPEQYNTEKMSEMIMTEVEPEHYVLLPHSDTK